MLAMALLALLPVMAMSAVTVTPDSLASYNAIIQISIALDTTGGIYPDTLVKWVTLAGTTNPPTARVDSGTTMNVMADTSNIPGLPNGATIYYQVVYTLRHGATSVIDTSVVDSAHTKSITITVTNIADSMTYAIAKLNVATAGADSIFRVIGAQFRFSAADAWEWFPKNGNFYARDSLFLVTPDTLRLYGAAPYDLRSLANSAGQYLALESDTIFVRVVGVGNDTTGSDTSASVTIVLPAIPNYSTTYVNGNNPLENGHLLGGGIFTQSNHSFRSAPVYIRPYKTIRAQARLFGFDNNRTFDSTYAELWSWNYGTWGLVATLITADIDTVTAIPVFYSLWDSLNVASTFLRTIGDSIDIRWRTTDSSAVAGDTMDLDRRGFEHHLDFEE
jgi:hypothetical protein